MRTLRLGTRGSALALAQARFIAEGLGRLHPTIAVETVVLQTSGDRFSLEHPGDAPPGSDPNLKAMFVKEIEEALLKGDIDLAVHSAKDLPAVLPEGLRIAAYPKRADPRDAFVGAGGRLFADLPGGAVVATSSLRRRLQLRRMRPDLVFAPLRGNVDTRLRKLHEGHAHGLVSAAAALDRLGLSPAGHERFPAETFVPAPGQGALAVEVNSSRADLAGLVSRLNDPKTGLEVELERMFLRVMDAGCGTPLGALARADADGISLTVFWSDPQGREPRLLSGRARAHPEEMSSLVEGLCSRLKRR